MKSGAEVPHQCSFRLTLAAYLLPSGIMNETTSSAVKTTNRTAETSSNGFCKDLQIFS